MQAAIYQTCEERAPVDFRLAGRYRHPDDFPPALGIDPYGLQDGCIDHGTVHTDTLVFRVHIEHGMAS